VPSLLDWREIVSGAAGRRGRVAAGVIVVAAAAAAVVAGITGAFGTTDSPGAGTASSAYRTSTATVTRGSLTSQTQVAATLGDAGTYSVVNQAQGTITELPGAGQVVRQGQVLYGVSGSPVMLLYGPVPAYRDLAEGMTGPDVAELNADLVQLRYATAAQLGPRSGWNYFSAETAYALEALQARLAVTQTGILALDQAVFLPSAALITGTDTVPGGMATPGSVVLTASSTTPVVTIALDPAQQTEVKDGEQVSITLPDGAITPGVVSQVAAVATAPGSSSSGGSGSSDNSSSSGSDSSATIAVQVALIDPKAAGGLNQAPVEVTITTGSVAGALVVPVDALLAQASGGYAVEVIGAGNHHHLAPVSLGLFDDAAGLVQVTGTGLAAGQHVVVPAA
jgi:hypothetical protein